MFCACALNQGTILIYGTDSKQSIASFTVEATLSTIDLQERSAMEANGYLLLEASNYTEKVAGNDGSYWEFLPNIGQRNGVMKALPDLAIQTTKNITESAKIHYQVYFESQGTFQGKL